ncbi:ribose-phosphate pyrophosphokinase-like domain-containing protein [Streptomyces sp. 142MFCol3.1]|uniref:ribose-phosphate pyrophosphokinase-like domain-containing protein n=1 Tax=Streptomyces sp. 142MFCol3.1 TaxID=1172179 RepID=UPI0004294FB4|nr:ribose-phosphate pyrophosphokinase-like domain-containing protein [Streptomyces sp. 142MFCol3.1]
MPVTDLVIRWQAAASCLGGLPVGTAGGGHARDPELTGGELLLLLDACRPGGAYRLTAVVPCFGYARQDRRTRPGQPVGVRVVVDAPAAVADRLVVVDPHTAALEAMCGIPEGMLTAVPVIAGALAEEDL